MLSWEGNGPSALEFFVLIQIVLACKPNLDHHSTLVAGHRAVYGEDLCRYFLRDFGSSKTTAVLGERMVTEFFLFFFLFLAMVGPHNTSYRPI
jgi:hypothetical protein